MINGKEVGGSGHGLFEMLFQYFPEGMKEAMKPFS
jgi:hypothetical protein